MGSMLIKYKKSFFLLMLFVLFSGNASADVVSMVAVPTSWKLENYIGDNVVAWYTESTCTNGLIKFSSSATTDDKDRFWAVVMTGKVSGESIFVRYDSDDCSIQSFGMTQE
jgi:hypothetical protein